MTRARPSSAVVVLSTVASVEDGERLAATLVDERLVACVNLVGPITSVYRWQGAVERAREVLLVMKTRATLVARLTARIEALHAYDVPEVVVLPIRGGAVRYLAWLAGETRPPARRPVARPRRRR